MIGASAIRLRLGFAISHRIFLLDRLGFAAALVVPMLDALVPRFIVTEDASAQRPDAKAGSAINLLDIRRRKVGRGIHRSLRGDDRGKHCSSSYNGGR